MRLVAHPSSDKQQNMHCRSTICVLLHMTLDPTQISSNQPSMRVYAVLAIEERRVPLPTFLKHSSSRTRLLSIRVPPKPAIGRSEPAR